MDYPVALPCFPGGQPIAAVAPQTAAVEYASRGPATLTAFISAKIRNGGWEVTNFSSSAPWSFDAVRGSRKVHVTVRADGSNAVAQFEEVGTPPPSGYVEPAEDQDTPAPPPEMILLEAIKAQDSERVTALLEQGADPDFVDDNGATPLFFAVINNNGPLIEMLIDAGADPNKDLRYGTNYLAQTMTSRPPRTEAAMALIENGIDVNAPGVMGGQPLAAAALAGDLAVVKALLARGANIAAGNERGVTALHSAASFGDTEIIGLLLDHGADVNAQQNNGFTPLHVGAALTGFPEVARMLLQNGADPTLQNADGDTAYDFAASRGHGSYATAIREHMN